MGLREKYLFEEMFIEDCAVRQKHVYMIKKNRGKKNTKKNM